MKWLGHGRALEAYLIGLKLLIGLSVFQGRSEPVPPVIEELQWLFADSVIAAPFLFISLVQLAGLILNIKGYECSWRFRSVGATIAIFIWCWIIIKCVLLGTFGPFAFPLAVMGIFASSFLLKKALQGLPLPGPVGVLP